MTGPWLKSAEADSSLHKKSGGFGDFLNSIQSIGSRRGEKKHYTLFSITRPVTGNQTGNQQPILLKLRTVGASQCGALLRGCQSVHCSCLNGFILHDSYEQLEPNFIQREVVRNQNKHSTALPVLICDSCKHVSYHDANRL